MDPEIPTVSVVDLGIVREVEAVDLGRVRVAITPTYSGCPAMDVIERSVGAALSPLFAHVEVHTVLRPAWTTDWITERGRKRLEAAGIAPPGPLTPAGGSQTAGFSGRTLAVLGTTADPRCPHCQSTDVERISEFGSTACKALWRCRGCGDPFDAVKTL